MTKIYVLGFLMLQIVHSGFSQGTTATSDATILGSASMSLFSRVSPEIKSKQYAIAFDSLISATIGWINTTNGTSLSPANPLIRYFVKDMLSSNKRLLNERAVTKNFKYTFGLSATNTALTTMLSQHILKYTSLTESEWNRYNNTTEKDPNKFQFASTAYCYSLALFGTTTKPILTKNEPVTLSAIKTTFTEELERVEIFLNHPIIKGKPGTMIAKPIVATFWYDSIPIEDLPVRALITNGRVLFTGKTNSKGSITVEKLKIPFVPNAEICHIQPNIGSFIDPNLFFDVSWLGIQSSQTIDETLMFELTKIPFSLTYSLSTMNDTISIPPDFAKAAMMEKFLIDSCSLRSSTADNPAQLVITLNCQVSNVTYDSLEATELKLLTALSIRDVTIPGKKIEQSGTIHSRSFWYNDQIPYGLFFWECSSKLKNFMRETLERM